MLYAWLTQLHFELVSLMLGEIGEAGSDDVGDVTGDDTGNRPDNGGA